MPPKPKAETPAAAAASNAAPSAEIKVKVCAALDSIPYSSIHVRVVSSWFDCYRTEARVALDAHMTLLMC